MANYICRVSSELEKIEIGESAEQQKKPERAIDNNNEEKSLP